MGEGLGVRAVHSAFCISPSPAGTVRCAVRAPLRACPIPRNIFLPPLLDRRGATLAHLIGEGLGARAGEESNSVQRPLNPPHKPC
jgi:hypothetical protein